MTNNKEHYHYNHVAQLPSPVMEVTPEEIENLEIEHLLRIYRPEVWNVMRDDIRQRLRRKKEYDDRGS